MSVCLVELPLEVSVKASQQFQDLELTRRSQDGDTEAFDELVTKYRAKVFSMGRNEHDARDLAQDAFLKAWQSIHRFDASTAVMQEISSPCASFGSFSAQHVLRLVGCCSQFC